MLESLSKPSQLQQMQVTLSEQSATIQKFPFSSPLISVSDLPATEFEYQVGGSLPANAPTYVNRAADRELYNSLTNGEFCYVLTSRQMGKSSLRVLAARRLQAEGTVCGTVDITGIGTAEMTPMQWYAGFTSTLANSFKIKSINFRTWWRDREHLPPVLRLNEFIEQVLLPSTDRNIVIFIDEIDSILSLNFSSDDFFAMVRGCYNKRAENPEYNRLTFALFGVTTPQDLIADKTRTPFNIGRAIELKGFDIAEATPLAQGLAEQVENSLEVLREILLWTGGQPFLTQKLCQLAVQKLETQKSNQAISSNKDRVDNCQLFIADLVQSDAVDNWEFHDEPEHLKTIRDRLLRNPQRTGRLLGLYQQILSNLTSSTILNNRQDACSTKSVVGILPTLVKDSPEKMELLLSGLIVKDGEILRVYNPIYAKVFNQEWIQKELAKLRPYSESIAAWEASQHTDSSRLLQGRALAEALTWATDKSLSDRDYQFLSASQELENLQVQKALLAEKVASKILYEANSVLTKAQAKARLTMQLSLLGLAAITTISAGIITHAQRVTQQVETQKKQAIIAQIEALNSTADMSLTYDQLGALIASVSAAKKTREIEVSPALKAQTVNRLHHTLNAVRERNRFANGHTASFSPDNKFIVSADDNYQVRIYQPNGKLIFSLPGHKQSVTEVIFSQDSKLIASTSFDKTVRIWRTDGTLQQILKGHKDLVWSANFSPNSKLIATASSDKTIKIWSLDGVLLQTLKGHTRPVTSVRFSPDGKMLASTSQDKTVKLWKRNGKREFRLDKTLSGHKDEVWGCNFSPNGKMIASASHDWTVKLWNTEGKLLKTLADSTTGLGSVNWSGDSKTVAGGSMDGKVRVWQADGTLLQTFKGHPADVWSLSFSPDRKILASAGKDSSVRLWSLDAHPVQAGELDKLLAIGCDWLLDYLQHNPNVEKDGHLCQKSDN
ncbi:AAA-like domain-containing protein [Tychonema sp. BBK16]|uniref:AAA-like domain-containing protein n=1 Tax=Tychonema sp. BBK16 TaxID=2699888 RepID=UPI001F21B698|nr:AAA-like domain-containing protein [Tychonema sp. BBK16]MCF6374631.1 AAA-like domain-containing protein [Tychonema sp. BBK16]